MMAMVSWHPYSCETYNLISSHVEKSQLTELFTIIGLSMFCIFIRRNSWILYVASSSHLCVRRDCTSTPTSRSLLVQYTPLGLTITQCTPCVDEGYIRTPPSTFAFPLFLFAVVARPHVWRQMPTYSINSFSLLSLFDRRFAHTPMARPGAGNNQLQKRR